MNHLNYFCYIIHLNYVYQVVSGIAHAEADLKACLGSSWCTAGLRLTKKYFASDDEADDDGQPFAELFVNEREQALVLPVPGISDL